MFSIPLIARGEKPSIGVRTAAASGLGMTLLYVVLSIFPIVDVKNSALFTAKVIVLILGIDAAGAWYFRRASKNSRRAYRSGENRIAPSFSKAAVGQVFRSLHFRHSLR